MANPYFIILAPENDIHAQSVVREAHLLGSDLTAIVDFSSSADWSLSWSSGTGLSYCGSKGEVNIEGATSLWWRRFSGPKITQFDAETNDYCMSEYGRALHSMFGSFEAEGRIKNPIRGRYLGNSKIQQLKVARNAGLRIPETLITNAASAASEFHNRFPVDIVAKGFGGTSTRFSPTQLVTSRDTVRFDSLRSSPVILQTRVSRRRDYRVTVVGDKIFSAIVSTEFRGADIDWRLDAAATCHEVEIDSAVAKSIQEIVAGLGLFFCTIDLIENEDGIYFLEVNECGQFLFVEIDTGLEISKALAIGLLAA